MTEKRVKYVVGHWADYISGRNKNHRFENGDVVAKTEPPCNTLTAREIVECLNHLHEENEQLKQLNKENIDLIRFIYNEIREDGYMDWGRIQDLVVFE